MSIFTEIKITIVAFVYGAIIMAICVTFPLSIMAGGWLIGSIDSLIALFLGGLLLGTIDMFLILLALPRIVDFFEGYGTSNAEAADD